MTHLQKYNKALAKEMVIARLGEGFSVEKISKLDGYPSYLGIIKWADKDDDFASALRIARVAGGFRSADRANELVDDLMDKDSHISEPKFLAPMLQQMRWNAERTARSTYGQQLEVKHSGTVHVRTSFLIPRTKQSVMDGEVIDLDVSMRPAQLEEGGEDDWMDE